MLKYFSESRSAVSVSSTGVATLNVKLVPRQSSSLFVNNYQVNKEYLLVQHHLLFQSETVKFEVQEIFPN